MQLKKTGNKELFTVARERANVIRTQREAEKEAKEARQKRFTILYEQKLKEIVLKLGSRSNNVDEEPPPSSESSDEEWGDWIQRTSDLELIDAKIQATFYASEEIERIDREEKLDTPQKMTEAQRRKIIQNNINQLRSGQFRTLIFSDRERPDNYVQFTESVCEVSSREFPASKLPALDAMQEKALFDLSFKKTDASEQFTNYCINYERLGEEQLVKLVEKAFSILGSPQDFEILVEF